MKILKPERSPASPFIFIRHIERMQEFYFSGKKLDERELSDI